MNSTVKFSVEDYLQKNETKDVIVYINNALEEKGYNAVYQMIGYLLSGDPTYITTHSDARKMIKRVERDDILEELLKSYLYENSKSNDEK